MSGGRLRWQPGHGGFDIAEYRGLRLRRKECVVDGVVTGWWVFIGYTGAAVRVLVIQHVTPTPVDCPWAVKDFIPAYQIDAGEYPGGWIQSTTKTYLNLQEAVDAFLDLILCTRRPDNEE